MKPTVVVKPMTSDVSWATPKIRELLELAERAGVALYELQEMVSCTDLLGIQGPVEPCPANESIGTCIYCAFGRPEKRSKGALFIMNRNLRESQFNARNDKGYPWWSAIVVLLHELAHAITGSEEENTLLWEQIVCQDLFPEYWNELRDYQPSEENWFLQEDGDIDQNYTEEEEETKRVMMDWYRENSIHPSEFYSDAQKQRLLARSCTETAIEAGVTK